jgi:ankyrin repeat protein
LGLVQRLLETGVSASQKAPDGSTALHCAARAGAVDVVAYLLDHAVWSNSQNDAGRIPLMEGFLGGNSDIVSMLLQKVGLDGCDHLLIWKVLKLGVRSRHAEILRKLLEHVDFVCLGEWERKELLEVAIQLGDESVLDVLLSFSEFRALPDSLRMATYYGNVFAARILILQDSGRDKARGSSQKVLSHLAARKGHLEVLNLLLERGNGRHHLRSRGNTLLHSAAVSGSIELVESVHLFTSSPMDCKTRNGATLLHNAAESGSVKLFEYLLDHTNLSVHCKTTKNETVLHKAALRGHLELAKFILERTDVSANCETLQGRQPLHLAALKGHAEMVKLLLRHEVVSLSCIDKNGWTPLHCAAEAGNIDTLRLLLGHPNIDINAKDISGRTPLHTLCGSYSNNMVTITTLLLDHPDIDMNAKDVCGRTPLHSICGSSWYSSAVTVTKLLLDHPDVDINATDISGQTPLHIASEKVWQGTARVDLLLKHNDIQADCEDNDGKTPLYFAAVHGSVDNVKLFLERTDIDVTACVDKIYSSPDIQRFQSFRRDRLDLLLAHIAREKTTREPAKGTTTAFNPILDPLVNTATGEKLPGRGCHEPDQDIDMETEGFSEDDGLDEDDDF